ncbi:MAG: hypothetical protein HZA54_18580 [Planctomycetes bacterium]|nr:hypothetical protein [Planctomycetota bacterium]
MDRARVLSNCFLAGSLTLLAFALLTGRDLPVAEGQAMTTQSDGILVLSSQSSGGDSAAFLLWVIDSARKRMSYYDCSGKEILIRGARNFTYDLEFEDYPNAEGQNSTKNFKKLYRDQYKLDPANKGAEPPEDIMKNAGIGEGTPAKLLAVAGVSNKGKGQEYFLWLVETVSHRIVCYSPEGNKGIKLVAVRGYVYDHQFQSEYPVGKGAGSVVELKKAFEDFKKSQEGDQGGKNK